MHRYLPETHPRGRRTYFSPGGLLRSKLTNGSTGLARIQTRKKAVYVDWLIVAEWVPTVLTRGRPRHRASALRPRADTPWNSSTACGLGVQIAHITSQHSTVEEQSSHFSTLDQMDAVNCLSLAASALNLIDIATKAVQQIQAAKQVREWSQLINSVLFTVRKCINTGFPKLYNELLLLGLGSDATLCVWEFICPLLLATQESLRELQKRLKLWGTLLYLILFFCFFSVFPNNFRHSCTTMPWTIWPALVLWGVCWMFYEPSADNGDEFAGMVAENNTLSPYPSEYFPRILAGTQY
jgi:hypothetical protein